MWVANCLQGVLCIGRAPWSPASLDLYLALEYCDQGESSGLMTATCTAQPVLPVQAHFPRLSSLYLLSCLSKVYLCANGSIMQQWGSLQLTHVDVAKRQDKHSYVHAPVFRIKVHASLFRD